MSNALNLVVAVLLCPYCLPAPPQDPDAKAVVLQKNEGELRTTSPKGPARLAVDTAEQEV